MSEWPNLLLGNPTASTEAVRHAEPLHNLMDADIPVMVPQKCVVSDSENDSDFGKSGGKISVVSVEMLRFLQSRYAADAPVSMPPPLKKPKKVTNPNLLALFPQSDSEEEEGEAPTAMETSDGAPAAQAGDPFAGLDELVDTTTGALMLEGNETGVSPVPEFDATLQNLVDARLVSDEELAARDEIMARVRDEEHTSGPAVSFESAPSLPTTVPEIQYQSAMEAAIDKVYMARPNNGGPAYVVPATDPSVYTDVQFEETTRRQAIEDGLMPPPATRLPMAVAPSAPAAMSEKARGKRRVQDVSPEERASGVPMADDDPVPQGGMQLATLDLPDEVNSDDGEDDEDADIVFDVNQALNDRGLFRGKVFDYIEEAENPEYAIQPGDSARTKRNKRAKQAKYTEFVRMHNTAVGLHKQKRELEVVFALQQIDSIVREYYDMHGVGPPKYNLLVFVSEYPEVAQMLETRYNLTFTQEDVDAYDARVNTPQEKKDGYDNMRKLNRKIVHTMSEMDAFEDDEGGIKDLSPTQVSEYRQLQRALKIFIELADAELEFLEATLGSKKGAKTSGVYMSASVVASKEVKEMIDRLQDNVNKYKGSTRSVLRPMSSFATKVKMYEILPDPKGWKNKYIDVCNDLMKRPVSGPADAAKREEEWQAAYKNYEATKQNHMDLIEANKKSSRDILQSREIFKVRQQELSAAIHKLNEEIKALQEKKERACDDELLNERRAIEEARFAGVLTLSDELMARIDPDGTLGVEQASKKRLDELFDALEECDSIEREITKKMAEKEETERVRANVTAVLYKNKVDMDEAKCKLSNATRARRTGQYDPDQRQSRLAAKRGLIFRTREQFGSVTDEYIADQRAQEEGEAALEEAERLIELLVRMRPTWAANADAYKAEVKRINDEAEAAYNRSVERSEAAKKAAIKELSDEGRMSPGFRAALVEQAWDAATMEDRAYKQSLEGDMSSTKSLEEQRKQAKKDLEDCDARLEASIAELERAKAGPVKEVLLAGGVYRKAAAQKLKAEAEGAYTMEFENTMASKLQEIQAIDPQLIDGGVLDTAKFDQVLDSFRQLMANEKLLREECAELSKKDEAAAKRVAENELTIMGVRSEIFNLVYEQGSNPQAAPSTAPSNSDLSKAKKIMSALFRAGVNRAQAEKDRIKATNVGTYVDRDGKTRYRTKPPQIKEGAPGNQIVQRRADDILQKTAAQEALKNTWAEKACRQTDVPADFIHRVIVAYYDNDTSSAAVKFRATLESAVFAHELEKKSAFGTRFKRDMSDIKMSKQMSKRLKASDLDGKGSRGGQAGPSGAPRAKIDQTGEFDSDAFRHKLYDELIEEIRSYAVLGSRRAIHFYSLICQQLTFLWRSNNPSGDPYVSLVDSANLDCSTPPETANFLRVSWADVDAFQVRLGFENYANNLKYILVQWASVPIERRAGAMPSKGELETLLKSGIVAEGEDAMPAVIDPLTSELMIVTTADENYNQERGASSMSASTNPYSAPLSSIKRTPVTWVSVRRARSKATVPINDAMKVFRIPREGNRFKLHQTQKEAVDDYVMFVDPSIPAEQNEANGRAIWKTARKWPLARDDTGKSYDDFDFGDFDTATYAAVWEAYEQFQSQKYEYDEIEKLKREADDVEKELRKKARLLSTGSSNVISVFKVQGQSFTKELDRAGVTYESEDADSDDGQSKEIGLPGLSDADISRMSQALDARRQLRKLLTVAGIRLAQGRGVQRYGLNPDHSLTREQMAVYNNLKNEILSNFQTGELKSATAELERADIHPSKDGLRETSWMSKPDKFELVRKMFNFFISKYYPWERLIAARDASYMNACVKWMLKLKNFRFPHVVPVLPDLKPAIKTHPRTGARVWVIFLGPSLTPNATFSSENETLKGSMPKRYKYATTWEETYTPVPSDRPVIPSYDLQNRPVNSKFGNTDDKATLDRILDALAAKNTDDGSDTAEMRKRLEDKIQVYEDTRLAPSAVDRIELGIKRRAELNRVADAQNSSGRDFDLSESTGMALGGSNEWVQVKWIDLGASGSYEGPLSKFPAENKRAVQALTRQHPGRYSVVMRSKLASGRVASVINNKLPPPFAGDSGVEDVDFTIEQAPATQEYLQWADQEMARQQALRLSYNQAGAPSSSTAIVPVAPPQDGGGGSGSLSLLELPDAVEDYNPDADPAEPRGMDTSASLSVSVGSAAGFETDDELSGTSEDELDMEEFLFLQATDGISAAEKGQLSEIDADSMSMILSMYDTGNLRPPVDIRGRPVRPVPLPELVLVA